MIQPSVCLLVGLAASLATAAEPGLVAHYTFDEDSDKVLKDHSGLGRDGTIHHAHRARSVHGRALAFTNVPSWVDCGKELGRQLTADMTVSTWVTLNAASYPDGSTNWTIVDCEDYTRSGFVIRIDGQSGKLYYRASSNGPTPGSFTSTSLRNGRSYHVAVTRQGNRVTLFLDGLPETTSSAEPPASPTRPFTISAAGQPFQGTIDDLAIYSRALSKEEILTQYQQRAAAYGKDTSWFGTFQLEPFLYLDRGQATVAVNFLGVLPLPAGAKATVELGQVGGETVKSLPATVTSDTALQDFTFDLAGLPAADYEIRAVLRDAAGRNVKQKTVQFRYPRPLAKVPLPSQLALPPLPAPLGPLPFQIQVSQDGGLTVQAQGRSIPLTAEFSYPHGDFNVLGQPAHGNNRPESGWKPAVERLGPSSYRIAASGQYYSLSRRVEAQPGRVLVQDTITNRTDGPLGVLLRQYVAPAPKMFTDQYVAGYRCAGNIDGRAIKTNPTLFMGREGLGLGLVALDDVFIVQSLATLKDGVATLQSDTFALDKKASYTLEWAIYVTPSGDYYDFINRVRRDEGRNGTVDGAMGFITYGPAGRRSVPTRQSVELRNIKYGLIHCLSFAADDPGVSIEGIEFMDFPKECRLLKEQVAAIHREFPQMRVAFHVAHSLYATNRPDQIFADSRVIGPDGRQAVYTANPGSYFSKERFAQGWNWYIYYPTLDNSFGKALLKSADVMMDEIGADGPFMDGFLWAYGGEYTYDRWDGHTAQIDPTTKTITRKMGSVILLSQDALVAFCRKIRDKGGVVIANNSVMTRTIAREKYILHDRECNAGPENHLAPTPTTLSLPAAIRSEPDIHRDVLDKLSHGNLYVYYEEVPVTHASAPAQMYPITFEEIHSGYVKGRERLITMHPGLYGWHNDAQLHFVYCYDARGVRIPHDFITTAGPQGVRTHLDLGKSQCAVVKKIPLTVRSAAVVNLHVRKYDDKSIELSANAAQPASLVVQSGEFLVKPQAKYLVEVGTERGPIVADAAGSLRLSIQPGKSQEIRVTPVAGR